MRRPTNARVEEAGRRLHVDDLWPFASAKVGWGRMSGHPRGSRRLCISYRLRESQSACICSLQLFNIPALWLGRS
ncbi:hypothetical protein F4861DRAFT_539105 [Xylaria intraflava]|nr:hypothetical protein F4861DRAFT_539105 [Xylaria intraflava]